jgi:monovalent cation:H+ antiporter-2, CPA2 family
VVAFVAGLVGSAIAARLGQSVILGYIVAGIVIGPFTPGPVGDVHTVEALADIGIIFLMFAIGVQLSMGELVSAGKVAVVGAVVQISAIMGLGWLIGRALGWGSTEGLFLGAVAAISSSAVLTKLLAERGEMETAHGRIALAWGAVQDVATVLLMVVLAALSGGGANLGADVLLAAGKAGLFLAVIVPLGIFALPRLFSRVADLRNREVFLLTIAVVALGTAYLSTFFGLSVALGAFLAGMVVSESDLSHQILGEIAPLRDLFAGLFFVSVGLLVDPAFVLASWHLVLLVLAAIIIAKGVLIAAIVALARHPISTAVLSGALLAQAGEFSFLLARLGSDLGAISPGAFSLMLAGAVASIVVSPFIYQGVRPALGWVERRLPLPRLATMEDAGAEEVPGPRGHVVICGYGRVGQVIGTALVRRGFRIIVIEQEQRIVRQLRAEGVTALLGNAANQVLLDRARLHDASMVVIATPDPLAARQIVDYARQVHPRIDLVVRTHSAAELRFMHGRGVRLAVMGELELALEMTRHTLRHFGISGPEIQATLNGLRQTLIETESFEEWDRAD